MDFPHESRDLSWICTSRPAFPTLRSGSTSSPWKAGCNAKGSHLRNRLSELRTGELG
jgi:hypothetical protein